jgi:hypothetical protein
MGGAIDHDGAIASFPNVCEVLPRQRALAIERKGWFGGSLNSYPDVVFVCHQRNFGHWITHPGANGAGDNTHAL